MEKLDNELEILLEVGNKSGTLEKIAYLKENESDERLKEILYYTFNMIDVFGISEKKLHKEVSLEPNFKTDDLVELLKYLKENNTGTDQDIANVQYFLKNQNTRYTQILESIITKSLTIGINAKNINKIWDELIPDYEVQQGERLEQNMDRVENQNVIVTQKFDGLRCSCRVEDGKVTMYSRNGNIYEGLHELENELAHFPNGMYDGELLLNEEDKRDENNIPIFISKKMKKEAEKDKEKIKIENKEKHNNEFESKKSDENGKNEKMKFDEDLLKIIYAPMPSKELFKKTTSLVNSDQEEKSNVNIWLYDMTPLENFDKMIDYEMPVEERKEELKNRLYKIKDKCPHLKETKYIYHGKFDNQKIQKLLKQVVELNQEGMMINIYGSKYEFKRSKNMIKIKQMYPIDLRVVDVLEGSGANKGKVGALVVNYKGSPLKVGSGLSKEQREEFWNDKSKILGKIITIKYFEETTNKKDNQKSLRFPIFLEVRNDKDEESYN